MFGKINYFKGLTNISDDSSLYHTPFYTRQSIFSVYACKTVRRLSELFRLKTVLEIAQRKMFIAYVLEHYISYFRVPYIATTISMYSYFSVAKAFAQFVCMRKMIGKVLLTASNAV